MGVLIVLQFNVLLALHVWYLIFGVSDTCDQWLPPIQQ